MPLLVALTRRGLLDPAPADGFRFHHVLVRDIAYSGIPKAVRGDLHEQVAEALEEEDGSDELTGYHLELAHRCRVEAGRSDRHARALADDAGERLGRAGIRAWRRADVPSTLNLLGRATSLLRPSSDLRRELLCELGLAFSAGGDGNRANSTWAETIDAATAAGDRRVELRARLERANVELFAGGAATTVAELVELTSGAIAAFDAVDDRRALGRAWVIRGHALGAFDCDNEAWEDASERALTYYELSGWPAALPISNLVAALYHGPTPVQRGIARCRSLLADADLFTRANVAVVLAGFAAQLGRVDDARDELEAARTEFAELGQELRGEENVEWMRGEIELRAGDAAEAERTLRRSCEALTRMEARASLAGRAADLAEALYLLERYGEAEEWSEVSERHAQADDVAAGFTWRSVRAKVLARSGRHAAGETLGREAVAIAGRTDAVNQHARTLLDLAEVVRIAGRPDDAARFVREACELFRAKGNLVGTERAESLLRGVPSA
jgi:hypothetical protein